VAQTLRFVHEVRGQEDGLALREQLPQTLPDEVPRLRVEAGRGLVEKDEIGIVDERARERQPPLHAARQRLDAGRGARAEARELEQGGNARADFGLAQSEVAAVHQQVLFHGEVGIKIVRLRHDADAAPRFPGLRRNRQPEHLDLAAVGVDQPEAQAQRRRLARAIGPEEAEAFPRFEREVDAGDHLVLAVALAQSRGTQMQGISSVHPALHRSRLRRRAVEIAGDDI
jgi:hypothetical protein